GDPADEQHDRPGGRLDSNGRIAPLPRRREEGAVELELGAVEGALAHSRQERLAVDGRAARYDVEAQRVDLDTDLPVALRLVVAAIEERPALAAAGIGVAIVDDVGVVTG